MRLLLLAFALAVSCSLTCWADSTRNVEVGGARTCTYDCSDTLISTDFLTARGEAYRHELGIGSFDSLNLPRASKNYKPSIDGLDHYSRKSEDKKHRGHDRQATMPESGSAGMLLMSTIVMCFAFWRYRLRVA